MINRRGFFGFLGASPFAARSVVKNVAKKAAFTPGVKVIAEDLSSLPASYETPRDTSDYLGALKYLLSEEGIPEWKLDEIKKNTSFRNIYQIDVDIDSLKSISPMAKSSMQRKRDIERQKQNILNRVKDIAGESPSEYFHKKFGFWL